uniref:SUZ domain-containing protein n=1 Tax=Macrostomum lignano TaxID=282301 RepID=A0A1I8JLR0_9PLAT
MSCPVQRPRLPSSAPPALGRHLQAKTGAFQLGQNFLFISLFQSSMATPIRSKSRSSPRTPKPRAAAEAAVEDRQAKSTLDEIAIGGNGAADLRPGRSGRSASRTGLGSRSPSRPTRAAGAARAPSGWSTQLLLPRQRRGCWRRGGGSGGGGPSGRPASPKLDNYLEEVPQPNGRASPALDVAGGPSYESRLRSKILAANPEFANVLQESPDPPPGPQAAQRQPEAAAGDVARPAAAGRFLELPAAAAAAEAASNSDGAKCSARRSLAPEASQISEETQLDLSRRLQFAQYLSDYFVIKQGEPCLNYGLLRDKKDFNPSRSSTGGAA